MPQRNYTASTVINYSPRKTRLILDTIRGSSLPNALDQLTHNSRPKSKKIFALLKSAASNLQLTPEEYAKFKIESIVAEEAQRLYRMIPRSRGSAHRIARRYSRIKVMLTPIS